MVGASPGRRGGGRGWRVVAGLLVLAATVRVAAMSYHDISGDDATVALVAKHFLTGANFPAFFYRQSYMGSVNGLHLVPALALFGPSILLVRLNAVAWSLLFPLGLYLLTRRVFDETTARVSLLLAAVPPFLLTYWSTVAEPHFETNTFGVFLLLLTLAALRTGRGPRYLRMVLCLGLLGGVAWWTNYKALEVILPALLLLWPVDRRLPLGRAGFLLAGGFLLGSLPVWLFYLGHDDPSGRAGHLFQGDLDLSLERAAQLVTVVVPTLLGSYYWPVEGGARHAALALNVAIYAVACLAAAVAACRRRRRDETPVDVASGVPLLWLTLVTPLAMLYVSRRVGEFDRETARYVLPVYIPLLAFTAALVVRLGRRSRAAGALVLAFLLGFDLWTHAPFLWPFQAVERARRAAARAARASLVHHLVERRVEAVYTDEQFESLRLAFLLPGIPVSDLTSEIYLPNAVAADAAERVAILAVRDAASVLHQLDALGATYRTRPLGGGLLVEEVRIEPLGDRPLARAAWRVRGDPRTPPAVADGDLATVWPERTAAAAAEMVVDLGEVRPVNRVIWWPWTDWEHTLTLTVAASVDGVAWRPLGAQPSLTRTPGFVVGSRPYFRPRDGWLELRATPQPARYLRFAPFEPPGEERWGIAELRVYAPASGAPPRPVPTDAVVAALRARGLTRLLADPAVSARIARAAPDIATRTANGVLDSHGSAPPATLAAPVRVRPTDGVLVAAEEADDLRAELDGQGIPFAAEPLGDRVLFHGIAVAPAVRCRRAAWRVTAAQPGARVLAVEARLQGPQRVFGLQLFHPGVSIRGVPVPAVAVSDDGHAWRSIQPVHRVSQWGWAGRTLFRLSGELEELSWAPSPAGYVRVELRVPENSEARVRALCVRGEGR